MKAKSIAGAAGSGISMAAIIYQRRRAQRSSTSNARSRNAARINIIGTPRALRASLVAVIAHQHS